MNYNIIDDDFIKQNNALILSQYRVQPRYTPEKAKREKSQVSDNHKRFLMVVYNNQYRMTLTEMCKSADLSGGKGSRIAGNCVKLNLIKILQIPFGRGRPRYPVLLSDGYKLLCVEEKTPNGRGAGYEHTLYQHLIAEHFKDLKPKIELNRNGKFIDVAIETNECLICIEVAMTSIHEKENIEKDFSFARAHAVIIACLNEKVMNKIQEIFNSIEEYMRQRIEVIYIADLLKIKPDELFIQLKLSL